MKAIFALLVVVFLSPSFGIDFAFKIPRNKKECFSEPMNPDTLVKGSFAAEEQDYQDLQVEIFHPSGAAVYSEPLTGAVIKFSYITVGEGNTNICLHNVGKKYMKIYFEMLTGVEAGDITKAANDEDLKPIEQQLVNMERFIKAIKTTTTFIVSREEEKLVEADTITVKLYIFSGITIVTIIAIAYLQVKYLERFFKSKKLI